ncbi:N,N-dimethylformamidase beta subunit family domain-containing protein [Thiothrix nivea]
MASSNAFALPCDFKNGDVFSDICAYFEVGTATIGGQLKAHVSTTSPDFKVSIRRAGSTDVLSEQSFSSGKQYITGTTNYNGLNWGSAYNINIPSNWNSGIYQLVFQNASGFYSEYVAVRASSPGSHSKILVLDSLPTKIAYSPIGGKSMYGFNSTNGQGAVEVSMERPTGRGQWTEHRMFATWLDAKGIAYEAASMIDIHRDPNLLKNYDLVIQVGHNEYWSKEMRDAWDSYLASGGNGAIFSGNTMWWQVRFSADYKNMVCYKNADADRAANPGISDDRLTVNWYNTPLNKPENLSTGVSFRNAGYHDYTENGVPYYVKGGVGDDGTNGGFKVTDASHWAFAGTGLSNGSVFGRDSTIAGYEVDGALFRMEGTTPVVTGEDGTPTNFQILAITPAYAVNSPSGVPGIVSNNYNGQGWGTVGVFKPSNNSGTVFVGPSIDWAEGLEDPQVSRITENVINHLKNRSNSSSSNTGSSSGSTTTGSSSNTGSSSGSTTTGSSSNTGSTTTGSSSSTGSTTTGSSSSTGSTTTPTDTSSNTTQSSGGGGGSIPLPALLLGLLTLIGLKVRKP